MRLILDDGKEIDFDRIKIIEVQENQRLIVKLNLGENANHAYLRFAQEFFEEFLYPAKVVVVNGEIDIEEISWK